jgi:hypothetical protein
MDAVYRARLIAVFLAASAFRSAAAVTARMKAARSSPGFSAASTQASIPGGKRTIARSGKRFGITRTKIEHGRDFKAFGTDGELLRQSEAPLPRELGRGARRCWRAGRSVSRSPLPQGDPFWARVVPPASRFE